MPSVSASVGETSAAPCGEVVVSTPGSPLSPARRAAIERAVKEAAWHHLRATDADTALSYYEPDAVVVSDGRLYPSFQAFADRARDFYRTLQEVRLATWDEMHVNILGDQVAVLTATVTWSSIDVAGVRTDLTGVWTAVMVEHQDGWKIRTRHESFTSPDGT